MTTQHFKTNLNCAKCVAAVTPFLSGDKAITRWSVDTANPEKILTVEGDGVTRERVERHVASAGFRVLDVVEAGEESRSFLVIYYPLLLIFGYLVGVVGMLEFATGSFDVMRAMSRFMAGFFLVFSFFKLMNLPGFVDAYRGYDIVASRWSVYAWAYPFIELALGVAYLIDLFPIATNIVTFVVMAVGTIGVAQAVFQKRRIRCACLGSLLNLPMSSVTLVEDVLMVAMSAAMLVGLSM